MIFGAPLSMYSRKMKLNSKFQVSQPKTMVTQNLVCLSVTLTERSLFCLNVSEQNDRIMSAKQLRHLCTYKLQRIYFLIQ